MIGDKVVEVWGPLPARTRLEDTHAEHPDKPVPDSVLYGRDAEQEFLLHYGGPDV